LVAPEAGRREAMRRAMDGGHAVSYSPALREGHLAACVLRRNVALPTECNPGAS